MLKKFEIRGFGITMHSSTFFVMAESESLINAEEIAKALAAKFPGCIFGVYNCATSEQGKHWKYELVEI
jgi:hypothetical protein